jgi:hypothetical protein
LTDEEREQEKFRYRQFVELLNTLRHLELVSAEYRRELDRRWVKEPDQRDLIFEELERLNDEHSVKLISRKNPP